jgi:hypothetical protein
MASPEAIFDCLYIVRRLEASLVGVTTSEVQLFDYLAQLLAVFRGNPSADWGYIFARTQYGAPYSTDIGEAMGQLELSGLVEERVQETTKTFKVTDDGASVLTGLGEQETLTWRVPFLEAACSSSFMLPVSKLREAIRTEPTIRSAISHVSATELLAGPALELLYEQFDALRKVLGSDVSDLLVPSSVWLAYLLEKSQAQAKDLDPPRDSPEEVSG